MNIIGTRRRKLIYIYHNACYFWCYSFIPGDSIFPLIWFPFILRKSSAFLILHICWKWILLISFHLKMSFSLIFGWHFGSNLIFVCVCFLLSNPPPHFSRFIGVCSMLACFKGPLEIWAQFIKQIVGSTSMASLSKTYSLPRGHHYLNSFFCS